MSDFTPVQIGLKDEAAYENIYTLYFGLANSADSFVVDVRKLLNDTELLELCLETRPQDY